jgi:hypothetical protein
MIGWRLQGHPSTEEVSFLISTHSLNELTCHEEVIFGPAATGRYKVLETFVVIKKRGFSPFQGFLLLSLEASICPRTETSICPRTETSICPRTETSICPRTETSICLGLEARICPRTEASLFLYRNGRRNKCCFPGRCPTAVSTGVGRRGAGHLPLH